MLVSDPDARIDKGQEREKKQAFRSAIIANPCRRSEPFSKKSGDLSDEIKLDSSVCLCCRWCEALRA